MFSNLLLHARLFCGEAIYACSIKSCAMYSESLRMWIKWNLNLRFNVIYSYSTLRTLFVQRFVDFMNVRTLHVKNVWAHCWYSSRFTLGRHGSGSVCRWSENQVQTVHCACCTPVRLGDIPVSAGVNPANQKRLVNLARPLFCRW